MPTSDSGSEVSVRGVSGSEVSVRLVSKVLMIGED